MTTTLTGKNQITVPAEITRRLGLVAGARFEWALGDQPNRITITVKPTRQQMLERIRELGRQWKKPGQDPIGDLIRERVRDDIEEGMWEK